MNTQQLLRIEDVMDLLQISRSTVNRLIKTHELHSIKLGKSRRFQREAIEEYIAQRPQS